MSALSTAGRVVLVTLLAFGPSSCAASAHFYSKTGRHFDPMVKQAVVCNEREADVVARAGGEPIGSIAARGMTVDATEDDVIEKAARVAGASGGTHVVLTERGVETFQYVHPATRERECTQIEDGVDCRTVETPATVSTVEHPTAKFVVLRLPKERWPTLPESLRPSTDE